MKPPSPYPRAIVFGVVAFIVLMIVSLSWALLEMAVIDPGHPPAYYGANLSWFYIVAGIVVVPPFAWLAARGLAGSDALRAGAAVAVVCIVIELAVQFASTGLDGDWPTLALPIVSKLAAGLAGGWLAGRTPPLAAADDDPTSDG